MFKADEVWAALEARQAQLQQNQTESTEKLAAVRQALTTAVARDRQQTLQRLATIPYSGAQPSEDWDIFVGITTPFPFRWNNHRQARQWAQATLANTATFAVDGSQIAPSRDLSLPIGLVQIGWFENPHTDNGRYTKNISINLLMAEDFVRNGRRSLVFADEIVNWRRFQGEVQRLIAYMEANRQTEPKPVCFYDGSLVVSFISQLHPDAQPLYISAVQELLTTSEDTRVPLVGFVDTSYAHDVVTMLGHLSNRDLEGVSDAALLRPQMRWGDRSQVFRCMRDDGVLRQYATAIYFTYLQTTSTNPPARVEFPHWLYLSGEHERVLDIIRAECVVGLGYPYAIETADAVAVLTAEDRERFYGLLQQFADQNDLTLRFSRKAMSKRQRR